MARRKKQEAGLFPAEKLARALVPPEEQPYPVPENWQWVYAPYVFSIEYGKGLPTKKLTDTGFPVFGANGQIGYYSEYMFEEPQALMSCRGAYSGVMNISLEKSFITNNSLIITSIGCRFSPKFIFFLLESLDTNQLVTGSAQPQVTVQAFTSFPIPIVPLAEQQRIVDRIESLFAKLDQAKEKAQAVVDGFEYRKAAILHKAFTGELTKKWRDEHSEIYIAKPTTLFTYISIPDGEQPYSVPKNWLWKKLYDAVDILNGFAFKSQNYVESGIRIIRITNVQDGYIEDDKPVYYPMESQREIRRFVLYKNDLLISLTGNVGRVALLTADLLPAALNQRVGCLRIKHEDELEKKYLFYLLLQKEFKERCIKNSKGSAQLNMSTEWLKEQPIPIAPLSEQRYIVLSIERMLKKMDVAKEAAEQVIETIDAMKKAILARAFRGELGTNNPADESAEELLKRIL